jgi:hypothetical protein
MLISVSGKEGRAFQKKKKKKESPSGYSELRKNTGFLIQFDYVAGSAIQEIIPPGNYKREPATGPHHLPVCGGK